MIRLFYFLLRHSQSPIINRILNKLANICLPVWFRISRTPDLKKSTCSDCIVSLTSFPARIRYVHLVVESLLRQSVRPQKILLYLSKKQFAETVEKSCLPEHLLKLRNKGLEIIMADGDLRSYKKFHYAFAEYPDSNIITVDDDIIYNNDLIKTLMCCKTRNNVVANLTRRIARDNDSRVLPYSQWQIDSDNSNEHIVIGAGGVMYSPDQMYDDILDSSLYLSLAPMADDMWLSAMARLSNLKVRSTGYPNKYIAISIPGNKTLYSLNSERNDAQVKAINDYYQNKLNKIVFLLPLIISSGLSLGGGVKLGISMIYHVKDVRRKAIVGI